MDKQTRQTTYQTRTSETRFETREDGSEKRIEGYFAVFGPEYELWPGATESVDPHAFDRALEGEDIRALIDHETRLVIGRTTATTLTLRADEHGLWGSILINEEDQDAMNLYARNKRGDVNQCSFGFDILDEEYERRADGTEHWTIKDVKLYEVSVCTFPAYRETEVQARRQDSETLRQRRLDAWKQGLLRKLRKDEKDA